jgi:hypothetical protein
MKASCSRGAALFCGKMGADHRQIEKSNMLSGILLEAYMLLFFV